MRQKMMDHRVRADCVQCHSLMDPIGFALENFDGIGLVAHRRTKGTPVDASARCSTARRSTGPRGLRNWLTATRTSSSQVVAEKLLTYALGRGVEYQDMPLVRAIARDAGRADTSVLGAGARPSCRSEPFQMNMKIADAPVPSTVGDSTGKASPKGSHGSHVHHQESTFRAGRS